MRSILNSGPKLAALRLVDLVPGQTAGIVAMHASKELSLRLQSLGFRVGKPIQVIRRAWFSGPFQVRLGMTDVMMRYQEAEQIEVCVEPNFPMSES